MDKKRAEIDNAYWDYVLTHDEPPKSVFKLCQGQESWSEADFYKAYASLEVLERAFWERVILEVRSVVEKDKDYAEYPARQKLLAFYYTFFEHMLQYRSRFLARFPRKPSLCAAKRLQKMECAFSDFVNPLMEESASEEASKINDKLKETFKPFESKGLWMQFLFVIQFNLDDDSEGFEGTDALIEKSVNLVFDARDTRVLEGVVDLARFLIGKANA